MKNVTIKDMIEYSNYPAKLIRSTIRQFGGFESFKESAPDVYTHGISGGFHGFIYYMDTREFFNRNRAAILKLAEETADILGISMFEMIAGFKCMKDFRVDEIAKAIYTGKGACDDRIKNCMAWFAGEEICQLYVEMAEEV